MTFGWSTALPLYTSNVEAVAPEAREPWYFEAAELIQKGYVFRTVRQKRAREDVWVPGIMEEESPGGNWVWKKRTREELGLS